MALSDVAEAPDAVVVNAPDMAADAEPSPVAQYVALFAPERVLRIELELPPAGWDALRGQTRGLSDVIGPGCQDAPHDSPFTWFEASVTIDGERLTRVGVRKKGFLGSLSAEKPSLKLDLDRYVDGQTLHGLERMTLNNGRQDPSLIHQCLGYAVWRRAGRPASRCNLARVSVNGEDLGVYVHVQDVREQMLREHFADGAGALYEGTLSDFREGWTATFDAKTSDARSELQAVVDALQAPDEALIASLESVIDLDAFFTHWALEVLVVHWDGYTGNTNNFFVYANPDDGGRLVFLPWGVDDLFSPWTSRPGLSDNGFETLVANSALAHRLARHPEGRARYEARLRELLETVWDEAWLHAEVDRLEAQVLAHSAPQLHARITGRIGEIRSFIDGRRPVVLAELDAGLPQWPGELRGQVCAAERGRLDWSFQTTFGTYEEQDLFATGTGTSHALTYDGVDYAVLRFGAKAGLAPEPEKQGLASILLAGVINPDAVVVVLIDLPPVALAPNASYDLDNSFGQTIVGTFTPSTGAFALIGFVLDGTLSFTDAGATDGAPVEGRITGAVYSFDF